MSGRRMSIAIVLAVACGAWSVAQAQEGRSRGFDRGRDRGRDRSQNRGSDRGQSAGQDRGSGRDQDRGDRGPRGAGFGPPGPITPEMRDQFYERAIDRQMERLTRSYDLTDAQREQVRQRLQALRDEDRSTSEQRMQQMNTIREQFRQLRSRSESGEQVDPQQYRQLGDQMRELFRSSPLMNRERIMGEMDNILPPDQAARGRQRIQEEQAREDQRRTEFRQRFEQWRQQGGDPREFFRQERERWRQNNETQDPSAAPGQPDGAPDGDRQSRREEWRRRWEERRRSGESGDDDGGRRDGRRDDDGEGRRGRYRDRRDGAGQPPLREDPLGPWERYVRDYISRYKLDASQQATARSVLRDMSNQRQLWEDSHRNDRAIIEQIEDPQRRQQQLDSLNAPLVRMFDELKAKLEPIPTLAQREAADGRRSTTQPALAATQPAADQTATRPAGERRDFRRDFRRDSGREPSESGSRGDSGRFRRSRERN